MSNTGYKKYISVLVIVMLLLLLQSITVPAITIAEESSNALYVCVQQHRESNHKLQSESSSNIYGRKQIR